MVDIITSIITYQFFALAILMLCNNKRNKLSNIIFGLFLLFKAFSMLQYQIGPILFKQPLLFAFFKSSSLLYQPLLYMYILSLTITNFKIKRTQTFLFILPSSILFLYLLSKIILINQGFAFRFYSKAENFVENCLYYCWSFFFILLSLFQLKKTKLKSSSNNSTHKWLQKLLLGFLVIWVVFAVNFISRGTSYYVIFKEVLRPLAIICLFIFTNLIAWYGYKYPSIFNLNSEKSKSKSGYKLNQKTYETHAENILKLMTQKKPYLNADITLNKLAELIDLKPRLTSMIINKVFEKNFFEFINSYRIDEAKSKLTDPLNNQTISEILYESGFNNKSVFNTLFRKKTGLTPTQYRDKFRYSTA